jgi:hypothetical protein
MPWQRQVAMVGGELVEAESGLLVPAYRDVVFTVPRQSGKTTLILSWEIQRAIGWGRPQAIIYSAQTGKDAREKLLDDQAPILEPRKKRLGIRRILRGMGNEAVQFLNGSRIGLLASMEESGHGKTVHMAVKDELWKDYDHRRDQSLVPAQNTVADAQMVTASTMGTDESVPLNEAVDRGRAAVEAGKKLGIAYFEWSAHPEADLDDPDGWWGFMPALGHTTGEEAIAHANLILPPGEYRRAYGNLRTRHDERVIPQSVWDAICGPDVKPDGVLTFALDMNPERSAGAIAVASPGALELVDQRDGTGWLVDRAKDLHGKHRAVFFVDAKGPAGTLIPDLEREGVKVHPVTPAEMVQACGQFFDGVVDRRFRVRTHSKLDDAVAVAAKRTVGDAWAWTRRGASGDISPLVAGTLALFGAGRPAPTPGFVDLADYLDD